MENKNMNLARAKLYQFLSALYQDEIPLRLVERMARGKFFDTIVQLQDSCTIQDFCSGLAKMTNGLQAGEPGQVFNELRYEYADLFLNAGNNPAFPYHSCYVSREPLVMQGPVAEVRAAYAKAGVHKNPDYWDLDDHLAVELEFMRYLAEQAAYDDANQEEQFEFLRNHLMGWTVEFCAVLTSAAQTDFYRGLAELTMSVLFNERMFSFSMLSEQTGSDGYAHVLEKMAAAIDALELGEDYSTLARGVIAPEPQKTVKSHCFICLGLCGQEVRVKDNIITGSKGMAGDPKGGGRLCIKGGNAHHNTYSAYRLKTPLIRENNRYRKASWNEALDLTVEKLKSFDPSTVGYHRGNDFNNWCHEAVMSAYGAPHKTTHRQMCDNPNRMVMEKCFSEKRPWIDYGKSEFILLFGINELATSAGQRKVNDLKQAVKRGAKLVVVDPRRSETANLATEWIQINPSTDGALALAMCYVIVQKELFDKEFVENWTYGFGALRARLLGEDDGIARTPEWAAPICGVPAETIERLALEFAAAAPACGTSSWTGVSQAPNTFHAVMAIQGLNALVGSFDAPGGPALVRKYKLASAWSDDQPKPPNNAAKVKLNKGHAWSGWIPGYFEEDVDKGNLKAMVCYFGEPVMSSGAEPSIKRAVEKLDFTVSVDCYMSNTTMLCDVILPDCTYLEQSRVVADWMYESFISLGQKAINPMYDTKSVVSIFCELGRRLGFGEYFPWKSEDEYLSNQLRNQDINLEELKKVGFHITDPHEYYKYRQWGSVNPPAGYGSSGNSATGKFSFIHQGCEEAGLNAVADYVDPWADHPELQPDEQYPMIAGYFRVIEHEHTSTFWNVSLMKACGSNPVWVNYVDAKEHGIEDGDDVIVASPWAEVRAKVRVTWAIRQGVLAAAGGFGHHRGLEGDPKYPQFTGFNTNYLLPPNTACKWSGTPPLKYIKTNIRKA